MRGRCGWTGVTFRCIQDRYVRVEKHDGWRQGWVSPADTVSAGERLSMYKGVTYITLCGKCEK